MQRLTKLYTFAALLLSASSSQSQAPGPGEYHVSYEMPTFVNNQLPQQAGTHLNGPGDTYRYTYFIDDQYLNNKKFYLKRATIGVHIIDRDFQEGGDDGEKEWGSITLNGHALYWIQYSSAKGFRQGQIPERTNLVEIMSDHETKGMPPYIFDVTHLVKKKSQLILEVTNLRRDGTTDSLEPYGNFTVLRGGLHLYYAMK